MLKALLPIFFLFVCCISFSQPINDKCGQAISITPSSDCAVISANLSNATVDPGYTNNDVWFSFVASSTTHSIGVVKTKDLNTTTKTFKPVIELFSNCGSTTKIVSQTIDGSMQTNQSDAQERTYINLNIGTTYYYRVYNIGSGSTLFDFNTYVCKTINSGNVNDELTNAIDLPVSSACDLKTFSISGATLNTLPGKITGTGYQFSDVWFKTVVPSNGNLNVILQNLGMKGEYAIALYRGTNYSNLTELNRDVFNASSNQSMSLYSIGLIPNETLFVRVCLLTNTSSQGTFKICTSTPPICGSHTPAGDNCANATRICDLNGYCGNTSGSYTKDEPSNLRPLLASYQSTLSIENNSWLSFIASATSATFTIYVSNCIQKASANGIQLVILEANNCTNFIPHSNLFSPGTADNTVLTATNLTVGQEYLIMIDGAAGAICDYTIATNSGVELVDAGPDQTYCSSGSPPLNLNATGVGNSTVNWSARAGASYTPSIGTTANLSLTPGPLATTRYIIDATGTCTGTKDSLLVTVSACLCSKPVINTNPAPVSTCPGSTASFSVTTTGVTYQWKESRDGGVTFTNLTNTGIYSGVTSNTLILSSITSNENGYQYKCIVKDVTGFCSDSTTAALLSITPLTSVTTNTLHVCKGSFTTITATNSPAANYTYVWTVPAGVANPGNVNSFSASIPGDYVCNISTPANLLCNSDFESYTSLGVFDNSNVASNCWQTTATDNKIEIWSTNPSPYSGSKFIELNATQLSTLFQKINLNAGSNLDISFAHRGRMGTDSVKVMIGPVGGASTTLGIFGTGNTAWKVYNVSYKVPSTGQFNLQFVSQFATPDKTYGNFLDGVTLKTGSCAVASTKITLINDPLPTALISGTTSVCQNDPAPQISFTGNDGSANYKFTYTISGGTNVTTTSTGNSAAISPLTTTVGSVTYDLVSVTDANNCSQNQSGSVTITVDKPSVGGAVNINHTVCEGSSSNLLTLSGNTGTITKWQYAVSPYSTWKDTLITTSTFTSEPLKQATKFRAVLKSGSCPEAYSTPVLVSVDSKSVAGSLSSSKSICEGQTSGLLTLTGNGNTIQKWQSANSPYSTWTDIANTNTFHTSSNLNDTTKYRVIVKSGVCPADTSNTISIKVFQYPKLNLQCGVTTNTTVQFTWDKIDGVTSYDFSYTIDNAGTPITGKLAANTIDTTITVGGMGKMVNFTLIPVGILCILPETANCISTTCTTPVTEQIQDITACAGDNIDIPLFISSDNPESFSWTNSNTAIGLPINGISDTLFKTAMVTKQEIGIIKVIAFKSPCKGPIMTFKITVNPLPNVTTSLDTSICKGASVKLKGAGADTYSWDNGIIDNSLFAPTITNTYKVTGTDVNNCKNTTQVKITVNDLPSIIVSNSGPICANDSIFTLNQSGDVLTKWSWKSDASAVFSDSLIKQPVIKKAINSEVFTLFGTDANGCKAISTTKLTINPLPVFSISANTPCEKQSLSLFCSSISASNFLWSHKGGFTDNLQNPTKFNCLLSDSGYYYLKFTDINQCSKLDSVYVKINPLPEFIPSAISPCESTPFSVSANYSNAKWYSWSGPLGLLVLGTTEIVFISNSADPTINNGDYSATVTDFNNCSNTKKVTVTVKPSPVISVSNNGPFCANDINFSVDQTGDVLTKWSWKSDKLALFDDSLVKQPKLTKVSNGEVFTLKGMDANGCSASATTTLIVNSLPIFTVSATSPCEGATLDLLCDLQGAKTYEWSHANGFTSSSQNANKTSVVLADTGAYSLIVTNAANCKDTHIVHAKINTLPVFAPSYLPPCAEKPLLIKANYSSASIVKKYEWTTPTTVVENFTATEITTITQKSDPKIHNGEYVLTITDVNNCMDTKKIQVSINPLPSVKSSNDFSICYGDDVTLTAAGAVSYSWDKNIINNTPFKPQTTTTYIVKGTDGNTCQNSDTVTVTVNPIPSLIVPELCETFDEILVSNHKPALVNAWASSDLSVASINTTTGKVLGLIAGKSTISFTDSAGCKIDKELIVHATPTILNNSLSVCENSQVTLKVNQTGASQSPWTSTSQNIVIDSNSGQVLGISSGTDSVTFTNNKGCKISKLFTVYGLPVADFTSVDAICIDDTLQVINKTSPVCDSYLWDFGDGNISQFAKHKFNKGGVFDISLTVVDSNGCQDSVVKLKQVKVVSKPNVTFTFSPDSIDVLNPEVRFKTNSDGSYFKWNFGDGLPTSTQKDPTHIFPTEEGKYYTITLTASNTIDGCSSTYTQIIPAKEPLIYYIPNTFTPNGDEVNNTFQPIFSSGLDPYSYGLYIYNRWGELIFESHNAFIGWDGTYNNQVVSSNTYVWKLEFKEKQSGREHSRMGHVNVIH